MFPHGSLAVDFFYMLSGFVLTYAYQPRIDQGWRTAAFLKVRLIRLYPLYLAGLILGVAFRLLGGHFGRHAMSPSALLEVGAAGLLLLPSPINLVPAEAWLYPLNFPCWSLFFELLANVMHVWVLRRRTMFFVGALVAVAGISLTVAMLYRGSLDFGVARADFWYGIPRVAFSYLVGSLVFRFWKTHRGRLKVPAPVALILLLAMLSAPIPEAYKLGYDIAMVIVGFPALLMVSASSEPSSRLTPLFRSLGALSYALYVLHVPVGNFFIQVWTRAFHREPTLDAPWAGFVFLVVVSGLALLLDRVYDGPARAWLKRHVTL